MDTMLEICFRVTDTWKVPSEVTLATAIEIDHI